VAWIFQILDLIVSLQKDALDTAGIVYGLTRSWQPNFSWLFPPRSFVIPWPRSGKMVDMAVNFAPLLLFLPSLVNGLPLPLCVTEQALNSWSREAEIRSIELA
jgi:hypothetical protein